MIEAITNAISDSIGIRIGPELVLGIRSLKDMIITDLRAIADQVIICNYSNALILYTQPSIYNDYHAITG